MSFFGGSPFYNVEPAFSPFFRLLDDFDNYSRKSQAEGGQVGNGQHHRAHVRTFSPKFDLKETESAYELHGELPGVEKDNVHIEFTDPQTIVVRGRVERSYTAVTHSVGQLEGTQMSGALAEDGEKPAQPQSHQATVEDDEEDAASTAQPTPASTNAELAKTDSEQVPQPQQQEPKIKYWFSERNIGDFSRSFQFPSRIEAEGVEAGLNNGILNVIVPKAKKHESRRIAIN